MAKKFKNRMMSSEEGINETSSTWVKEEVEEVVVEEPQIEFDGWWALRGSVIPAIHKKEVIKADFKGRKVPMVGTLAMFDAALKKYGVKLT